MEHTDDSESDEHPVKSERPHIEAKHLMKAVRRSLRRSLGPPHPPASERVPRGPCGGDRWQRKGVGDLQNGVSGPRFRGKRRPGKRIGGDSFRHDAPGKDRFSYCPDQYALSIILTGIRPDTKRDVFSSRVANPASVEAKLRPRESRTSRWRPACPAPRTRGPRPARPPSPWDCAPPAPSARRSASPAP